MKNLVPFIASFLIALSGKAAGQISQQALQFDGWDDRVMIPPSPNYQIGTADFTVEAWIRDTQDSAAWWGSTEPIFCIGWSSNIYFAVQYGRLFIAVGDSGLHTPVWEAYPGPDLRDNACHHVAVVRQGTDILFYRDGVHTFTGSINGPESLGTPDYAMIGSNDVIFKGTIKEVKFWQGARTPAQVESDMHSGQADPAMLGYWKCDETSGLTVYDAFGNDGTLGAPLFGCYSTCYPVRIADCCGASCINPVNLYKSDLTSTSVKLKWTTFSCATSYQVRYKVAGTTTWTKKTVTGNIGHKKITGLAPGTLYRWQLRSRCAASNPKEWTPWSSSKSFTTPPMRTAGNEVSAIASGL